METIRKNIYVALILAITMGFAQISPEQQEQIEKAQKEAMEMMNSPEMKKMMEQFMKMDDQKKTERKKQQAQSEKERIAKAAKHREEFYWRNKIASNTQGKFSGWKWGRADIAIYDGDGRMDENRQYIDKKYVVVGSVNADGQILMSLPKSIGKLHPIGKALIPEMHSVGSRDVTFSNPNILFRRPGFSLLVVKDYRQIGSLYIGNSEKVTYNLAAPCCLHYGDEGYRLYWVYVKETCTAKLHKEFKGHTVTEGEAQKTIDQTIIYDMDFKPGWNLVKSEVIGHYTVGGSTRFKTKKHTVVPTMPADARYYFTIKE